MGVISDKIQQEIAEELAITKEKGFHEDEFVRGISSSIGGDVLGIPPMFVRTMWESDPIFRASFRGTLISLMTQLLLGVQLIDRQEEEGEDRT